MKTTLIAVFIFKLNIIIAENRQYYSRRRDGTYNPRLAWEIINYERNNIPKLSRINFQKVEKNILNDLHLNKRLSNIKNNITVFSYLDSMDFDKTPQVTYFVEYLPLKNTNRQTTTVKLPHKIMPIPATPSTRNELTGVDQKTAMGLLGLLLFINLMRVCVNNDIHMGNFSHNCGWIVKISMNKHLV
ncbi:uncharacterized protein [Lepeophtheirus salmonis]|uniref:uncharacterized protein isoform X3 n=1 Tax=Lepeophtheirus salmonis TaxID=72036 RepID=UPI001AE2C55E|nr:uncharacterized protein LOC121127331 isoform X3 [Lepeophtheirus salmonis]